MPEPARPAVEELTLSRSDRGGIKSRRATALDVRRVAAIEELIRGGADELTAFRQVAVDPKLGFRDTHQGWFQIDGACRSRLARLRVRVAPEVVERTIAAVEVALAESAPRAAKTIEKLSSGDFADFKAPIVNRDGEVVGEKRDPASADVARRAAVDHLAMLGHGPGVKATGGGNAVQVNVAAGATDAHVAAQREADERVGKKLRWCRETIETLLGFAPDDVVAEVVSAGDALGFRVRPTRAAVTV